MSEEKFAYRVELAAEDYSFGYVVLTQKEADLVARVTNPINWEHSFLEKYSGCFIIDNRFPIPLSEYEKFKNLDMINNDAIIFEAIERR